MALDQGTTSSRAMIFDARGAIVTRAQAEFPQYFPQPGWVEHDAREIWSSQLGVAREALQRAGLTARDVAAIGITNQRETVVVWDRKSGEPVARAIVWQDRRTAEFCDRLRTAGHAEMIRAKTGLVIDAYFSGSKLAWLLEQTPGLRARAERGEIACGTVDSWLLWQLTGGRRHATDASNASRTMLFNIHENRWDEELLTLLNIPAAMLPEVVPSSAVYGTTAPELLGEAVAIAGMAGDQQAALFGQLCHAPGMAKITYGTGGFLLQHTGRTAVESRQRLLTTVAWDLGAGPEYALEGSIFVAGAVVQWLRDGLGIIKQSEDIRALAASVPDSGGVCFVPAFVGLGAPHWDPYARGTVLGLTRGSTAAHLARAAEEAIAFQVLDVVQAMQNDSGLALPELRADGGAAEDDLLLQIQSDVLQRPLVRPAVTETTAFGAAALAGLAAGVWSREALEELWRVERRFEPQIGANRAAEMRALWRRGVERATGWAAE
jgi:glycerol kinase